MDVAESSQDGGEQVDKRKEFRKDGTMQWETYQILTHKADTDSQKPKKKSGWGANLLSKNRKTEQHKLHPATPPEIFQREEDPSTLERVTPILQSD